MKTKSQKFFIILAGVLILVIGFTFGRTFVSYVLDALG